MTRKLILDKKQTLQKIKRIAYEIMERNHMEQELVIAGIWDRGYFFAELLAAELRKISSMQVTLVRLDMEKYTTIQTDITLSTGIEQLEGKAIIITDDVLNSGKTIIYAMKPFLNIPVKRIQVAVIVDRDMKNFPVHADYVGYSMATTLLQHVEVEFSEQDMGVYLH